MGILEIIAEDRLGKSMLARARIAILESGEYFPRQKTLRRLARAFGVDVTDLM